MVRLAFCIGLVALVPWPAFAGEVKPSSAIQSVTVFAEGASVTRRVPVTLPVGGSTVVIGDLPAEIEANSIRVDGTADQGLVINSVETRVAPADPEADPQRVGLMAKLETLQDRLAAIGDRTAALEGRRQFIEKLIDSLPGGFSKALPQPGSSVDTWSAASAAIGNDLATVADALRALQIEQRGVQEQIDKTNKALSDLPPPRDHAVLSIALSAEAAATGVLTVSYRVPSAHWVPAYDALLVTGDAGGAKPALSIVRRGEVAQSTGEDWTDVALTLSTARPASGTAAPELDPSLVSVVIGDADSRHDVESLSTSPARAEEPDTGEAGGIVDKPVVMSEAVADFGDFHAEYRVAGTVSVASGTGARAVRIASSQEPVTLEVRAVPALSASAYLHAKFVAPAGAPILPGNVALFRDGAYVGATAVAFINGGATLDLGFGTDDAVKVKRTALSHETGETGLLSTRRTDARSFRITVENLHRQPMSVTVVDRMPYSENEDIVVARASDATDPTAENVDDRRGVLAWTYVYAPGESRDIKNAYQVSWPSNESVVMAD